MIYYFKFILLCLFMGLMSWVGAIKNNFHLLSLMVLLESVLLSGLGMLSMSIYSSDLISLLMILVMSVCEGGIGVSLVVAVVRGHGNDYVLFFYLIEC